MKNLFKNINPIVSYWILFAFFLFTFSDHLKAQSCSKNKVYGNNRIDYQTIIPCNAKKITLYFDCFKVADVGDLLKIYDGADASGKPLHPGNGFTYGNPPTVPLVAYSGAMYLYFSTNGSGTDSGYVCHWTAEYDTVKPIAEFEIADTIYNGVKFTCKNTSQNVSGKNDYTWKIEPGYGEVSYSKDLNYILYANNTFDVTLEVFNCSGWDKYTKKIAVITPDYKVALDFKAKKLQPVIYEVDTLSAIHFSNFKRPNKADRFHWYFSPDSVTYINGSTADSPMIYVKFNTKGKYKVTLEAWDTSSPLVSYNEVIKKDYITVKEPPSPKVYLDIIAKNTAPKIGETDTLFAIDSIPGKPFKANRFRWEFNPSTVTYLNGTSPDMQTIQVKFNDIGKYTVSLKGWNSSDSAKTFNDTIKTNYITVEKPIVPKVYLDFVAKNLEPKVGEFDTIYAIDSIKGQQIKANRFRWEISPNRFSYENGTNANSKTIQVKFKTEGNYTVTLFGWNSEDSAATYNDTIKTNYIKVKGTINYKVYLDFKADNFTPKIGDIVTIQAMDSLAGRPYKANRFRWEFLPDKVTYVNGTSSENQIIHVRFNEKGKYSIILKGWNWADSLTTYNFTTKTDYINVEDTSSSVKKISNTSSFVNIYPNPSNGKLNFSFVSGNIEATDIQIYNATGQLIKKVKVSKNPQTIDLSNELCGLYTFRITSNNKQFIRKISIVKD